METVLRQRTGRGGRELRAFDIRLGHPGPHRMAR